MSENEVVANDHGQAVTVFLGVNGMWTDDNVDFAVLTRDEIKREERR